MTDHVLITGGAGFIGSCVADELLRRGVRVRVLDSLVPQVHGAKGQRPSYLARDVELVVGDVRDGDAVRRSLRGIRAVIHLAARVGVGQSMYEIADYTSVNGVGTAVLLEAVTQAKTIERLVVASSMSVYGEGLYRSPSSGALVDRAARSLTDLRAGRFDVAGPGGEILEPVPTTEWKATALESVYALSKLDQERLCLIVGRAYGIPTVALRLFNVYGPRQALSNPYTGVMAIFAARLLNRERPQLFEDGLQKRDFVSSRDVAAAFLLALESKTAPDHAINIASGEARTVRDVAQAMGRAMGKEAVDPDVTGRYRMGDVRHCYADIGEARRLLGYDPKVSFDDGLDELVGWLEGQVAHDGASDARAELEARGLTL